MRNFLHLLYNVSITKLTHLLICLTEMSQNPVSRSEIEKLVEIGDERELKSRLLSRMEFGTAGLRSRMGAGYSMMNDLTIIRMKRFY